MSATPRTFHCLAGKGDKEDLHFEFSAYRSEEVSEQDGKALGDWLNQNLSAKAYLGMILELKEQVGRLLEVGIKQCEFYVKRKEAESP